MPEIKEKEINNFTGSNCVIRDDDHGWGGPDPKPEKIIKEKIKKTMVADEPLNWPFYHQSKWHPKKICSLIELREEYIGLKADVKKVL